MSGTVTELTDHSFEERVLRAEGPVLVEFWAEWCGPCKILAPILDEIAAEYAGRLTVAKLNIDQNPATAPQYDVRAIPALLVFKNGIVTATKAGCHVEVPAHRVHRREPLTAAQGRSAAWAMIRRRRHVGEPSSRSTTTGPGVPAARPHPAPLCGLEGVYGGP